MVGCVAVGQVKHLLGRLSEVASLYGNSTQRMSAYFLEGLLSRISGGPKAGSASSVEFQYCSFDCGAPLLRAFEVRPYPVSNGPLFSLWGALAVRCGGGQGPVQLFLLLAPFS